MAITLNTFGLRSINSETFNTYGSKDSYIPKSIRDQSITSLRINNLVLNILGYFPGASLISGSIRIGIGLCIILFVATLGSPTETNGFIIGRWYFEALITGAAQVARGALEAFCPYGRAINLSLDSIGTIINLKTDASHFQYTGGLEEDEIKEIYSKPPWGEVSYPCPLYPLYLV